MARSAPPAVLAAVAILAVAVSTWSCDPDWKTCEEDLDCVILCDCGAGGTVTVGPYPCRVGTCGRRHFEDSDCVRPCENAWILGDDDMSIWEDDDSGDDDSGDDDDSGSR